MFDVKFVFVCVTMLLFIHIYMYIYTTCILCVCIKENYAKLVDTFSIEPRPKWMYGLVMDSCWTTRKA